MMTVGFFNVYLGSPIHTVLADLMIRSVRRTMPDVPIVMLTDEDTPAIYGVDEVRRLPKVPFDVLRCDHLMRCEGEWLYLDTDCIVQKDVRHVFGSLFSIAVADREGCLVEGEEDLEFIKNTPYNLGVVFSRSTRFWGAVMEKLIQMTPERQEWMGIQFAACEVIGEGSFGTRILPGTIYNYAPHRFSDDVSQAAIVHYKGPTRKEWMMKLEMAHA